MSYGYATSRDLRGRTLLVWVIPVERQPLIGGRVNVQATGSYTVSQCGPSPFKLKLRSFGEGWIGKDSGQ